WVGRGEWGWRGGWRHVPDVWSPSPARPRACSCGISDCDAWSTASHFATCRDRLDCPGSRASPCCISSGTWETPERRHNGGLREKPQTPPARRRAPRRTTYLNPPLPPDRHPSPLSASPSPQTAGGCLLAVRWFTIQWKHMIRPENTYRKRIFTGRPHLSRTIRDNAFNRNKEQDHMPINSKYVFVASMDVDLDKEDLFNEVYDTEHIPN